MSTTKKKQEIYITITIEKKTRTNQTDLREILQFLMSFRLKSSNYTLDNENRFSSIPKGMPLLIAENF